MGKYTAFYQSIYSKKKELAINCQRKRYSFENLQFFLVYFYEKQF